MESFEEVEKFWKANKGQETNPNSLTKESVENMIKPRIKKEQHAVMQYFWASFIYQMLIYALASHLMIRFWGDAQVMLLSLAGALLYIPFTIVLMRKFKAMARMPIHQPGMPVRDVYSNVQMKYTLLTEFFRFKRRFDWVAIPLSCLIIVAILFKLYVNDGLEKHLAAGIITYLTILALFIAATYVENKKRFKKPLRQLKLILKDLEQ